MNKMKCKEILDESDPPVDIHMPLKNLGFTRRALITTFRVFR